MTITKRCSVCGRFRHYAEDDAFCVICGNESLESECTCGRGYDYALEEGNQGASLHCPKCGRALRGRSTDFEP
jgi:rubrerythrin